MSDKCSYKGKWAIDCRYCDSPTEHELSITIHHQSAIIEKAKGWIQQFAECRCDEAWTKRGRHEPYCLSKEAKETLAEIERMEGVDHGR